MNEKKQTIIFDSSGLTALINETDEFHNRALSMSEILADRASWRVLLPHEIFAETVTAISKRVSQQGGRSQSCTGDSGATESRGGFNR
jgi:hypothetical protein